MGEEMGFTGGVYPVAQIRSASGRASLVWSWREESNLQPAVYKTAALPIELRQPAVYSTE